jgi:dTDP-glucose pyrophosphorylase
MTKILDNSDMLIAEENSLREAMRQLDLAANGILFVVSKGRRFLGTMTDGDIRRGLLRGAKLTDKVASYYNSHAYTMLEDGFDKELAKRTMYERRYKAIPLLSSEGILVAYVKDEEPGRRRSLSARALDIPVVIMAGGKGTRMAPFTNVLPKPLIPVGEKTILELIIDEFLRFGIKDYYFTINYRGEMIRAYFDCIEHGYSVKYLKETGYFGTAGSLSLLPEGFPNTFIVSNCDIIVKADFADVLDFHRKSGAMLTVLSSIQHHKIPYGVINFESGGVVTSLEEKPELSFCINTGVYILEAGCLNFIPKDTVFHMTSLMEALMSAGKRVVTYPVSENDYLDIGQWEAYRKAVDQLKMSI